MFYRTAITFGVLIAGLANAAPSTPLQARDQTAEGFFYMCTGSNWGGSCNNWHFFVGQCCEFLLRYDASTSPWRTL